jgi:hypothetical protein
MPINFRISALVPVGLIVESVAQLDDSILVTTRFGIQMASCPLCGSPSRRVHSRSVREVSDLPCSGRSVRLRVVIRRYRRDTQHCRRRIFVERFNKAELDLKNRFAEYIAANGWKVESGAKFFLQANHSTVITEFIRIAGTYFGTAGVNVPAKGV